MIKTMTAMKNCIHELAYHSTVCGMFKCSLLYPPWMPKASKIGIIKMGNRILLLAATPRSEVIPKAVPAGCWF